MSDRCIKITDCGDCPNVDHKGAFGQPATVPYCAAEQRTLPYTIKNSGLRTGAGFHLIAQRDLGIPDWCPLAVYPTEGESQC